MKWKIAVVVGSLIAAMAVPAVAFAQEAPSSDNSATQENRGRFGEPMDVVTDLLGVSKGDVISHVRTGGTLASLAEENGSSGDAVIDALMVVVDERIDEAVASGDADPDKAEEFRAKMLERITTFVYTTHDGPDGGRRGNPGIGNGEFRSLMMDTIQSTLDVNQGQLVSHIRTGGTLAELAEENGSSGPELEADLVAAVDARLAQAVVDGDITEEQAAQLLERATEHIGEMVYKVFTPGRS